MNRRTVGRLGVVAGCLAALAVASCDGGRETAAATSSPAGASLASASLPELAAIGGAQDIWPFPFGLDASREGVRDALGDPGSVSERPAGTGEVTGRVIEWTYPGVGFTFFVDAQGRDEYLLAAGVTSADVALRGGLAVGMTVSKARDVLGEPDVRDGPLVAYFYFTSTIELSEEDGVVTRIVLARALP